MLILNEEHDGLVVGLSVMSIRNMSNISEKATAMRK